MEIKAKIFDLARSLDGKVRVTLEFDGSLSEIEKLLDKLLRVTLKPWREKRSLDANAYCWALIGQIADIIGLSKDEVYVQMLHDYGQSDLIRMDAEADPHSYFKYFEVHGNRYHNGVHYTDYIVYKGSSEYNTYEMSVLLDGIIQEAEQLGIHTITPKEAERLKERWG